ncbi:hypothetical protein G5V59_15190 [Nocardioides sp. W3-2-3]|nr:hypothetical protein [Nocardioides convexus]
MTERPARRNAALRDAWFQGAQEILASEGYGALKPGPALRPARRDDRRVLPLLRQAGRTSPTPSSTSWVRERTEQTVAIARGYDDPAERLLVLARASADLLHRTEAAIRVWAGVDDRVGAVQRRVDESRHAVVLEAMTESVGDPHAHRYATWALSTLVGYEMVAGEGAQEDLLWSLHRILDAARGER